MSDEEVKSSRAEGEGGEDAWVEPEAPADPGVGEPDVEDPHKDDDEVKA